MTPSDSARTSRHSRALVSLLLATTFASCTTTIHSTGGVEESKASPEKSAQALTTAHDKPYWREIVRNNYAVPAGESPLTLMLELTSHLGSTDPELRDAYGYDIPAHWIYAQKLLSPEELRVLMRQWMQNLRVGIGEHGDDGVLLRSFSALDVSLIAAYDLQQPFFEPAEFEEFLGAALSYLADERDVRGYVAEKGWHHSAAHTADLLKFLARNRHLQPADQARILNAIADKIFAPETGQFTHGEDERLAATVLSIVRRQDFDANAFEAWLGRFTAEAKPLWQTPELDHARFDAVQSGKSLLKSLFVALSSLDAPTAPESEARALVLRCLRQM